MAIQIPNPGTGNGQTGDNEFVLWTKTATNFSDQTNAASKLVGTGTGQIPLAQDILKVAYNTPAIESTSSSTLDANTLPAGTLNTVWRTTTANAPPQLTNNFISILTQRTGNVSLGIQLFQQAFGYNAAGYAFRVSSGGVSPTWRAWEVPYTDRNATKDANGFLKGASPVADLYDDRMDLNHDAIEQGGITFEKLGVGDYLVKGSLGFAQEGWYIETPKDANGNVLVAVVYEQLAHNDISIKTYAKRFDDETGDIVPNLTRPRDIPTGRFISLRLHELTEEVSENLPEVK